MKSYRKFLLLWTGSLLSSIGSGLTSFGLAVYIFQRTGRASDMALVTLVGFLPPLLLSAPAGVLADRYDRRLLMVAGDSLSALGLVYIYVCMGRGGAQLGQILLGVGASSLFTALLEPAYKATITDLLTPAQYSRASGMAQLAGSAKYLVSPILAGFLLTRFDIRFLLLLDIATFFVTAAATLVVRKGLQRVSFALTGSFLSQMREGFHALTQTKGVLTLVVMGSAVTFCLGVVQTLTQPMILGFASSATLGTLMTAAALGMLVSSLVLGAVPLRGSYVRTLCVSLFGAGVFMALFGLRENLLLIGAAGFLFFSTLPFANASMDVLLRANLDNRLQGRAWGLVGLISQLGYVAAYALSGVAADTLFTPLLLEGGALASSVGRVMGTGAGRGIGLLILLAGLLLCGAALWLSSMKPVKALEHGAAVQPDVPAP